ncbi:DUF547 domain-containing protein [Allomuricauda sp. F6463D]|uniref:DUF547 domain-containing protein n=1 Tax=Allomuricauda sp. F6463D TaxID=2926409 RepID=UPI001FF4F127|nr:DUF547 domain-containing protein [Muricauda sp. F6463D]MCK0160018.1 DUF547 domain-containing protein [Muricauda sp. F6463D]
MKLLFLTILFSITLLIFTPPSMGQFNGYNEITVLQDKGKYPDHTLWQFLLQQHVDDNGQVDYQGFAKDRQILEGYLKLLKEDQPTQTWSKNEKLAYYINLYNAYTVLLILDNYPTESIKKIKKPWDQELIPLKGDMISLGDLEHKILRKMEEPRIHFAINCASASCPKLSNKAYEAKGLDEQLESATKDFINSERNQISREQLNLSKIFKWYKNDFLDGDIRIYIKKYTEIDISSNADIDYLDYDWGLNGK